MRFTFAGNRNNVEQQPTTAARHARLARLELLVTTGVRRKWSTMPSQP